MGTAADDELGRELGWGGERPHWEDRGYLGVRRWRDLVMAPLVVPLARLGVAPWAVSLLGVALAATTYFTLTRHPPLALAAFAGSLLCDAADGALARRRGCAGARGKLLDLLCDSATLTALLLALVAAGVASPVRAAYGAYVTLLLLFVAVCFHTTRHPGGEGGGPQSDLAEGEGVAGEWSLRPRGGFYAHLPKVPIYAALVLWLVGGPQWVDAAVLVANLLATVFAAAFVGSLLQPCEAAECAPPAPGGRRDGSGVSGGAVSSQFGSGDGSGDGFRRGSKNGSRRADDSGGL